jgi:hypothetical protein
MHDLTPAPYEGNSLDALDRSMFRYSRRSVPFDLQKSTKPAHGKDTSPDRFLASQTMISSFITCSAENKKVLF